MAGLYKKVLAGKWGALPPHFSDDLSKTVGDLMRVEAQMRPSCSQILELPQVRRISEQLFGVDTTMKEQRSEQIDLLQTIKVPKNLLYLTDRLPKPFYQEIPAADEKKEETKERKKKSQKPKKLKSQDEYSPVGEENSARGSKLQSREQQTSARDQ